MAKLTSLKAEKRQLDRRAADPSAPIFLMVYSPPIAGSRSQLSDELEVSRGTVRSALAQLASEGLVQQVAFTRWEVSGSSTTGRLGDLHATRRAGGSGRESRRRNVTPERRRAVAHDLRRAAARHP